MKHLFLIILAAWSCWGALYVSNTNGNDSWNGLAPEWDGTNGPKKTYASAQSAIATDQERTIKGKRGDVWRVSITPISNITYSCYGDSTKPYPEINGSDLLTGGSYVWNQSTTTNEWYVTLTGGVNPSVANANLILVDGEIYDTAQLGKLTPYTFRYGNNDGLGFNTFYVYSQSSPSTKKIEVVRRPPINIVYSPISNVKIEKTRLINGTSCRMDQISTLAFNNCVFENSEGFITIMGCSNVRIESNTFRRFTSLSGYGIALTSTANNVLLYSNLMSDGWSTQPYVYFHQSGICNCYNNTFTGSRSTALLVDNGTNNVDNNTFTGVCWSRADKLISRTAGVLNFGEHNNVLPSFRTITSLFNGFTPTSYLSVQPKFVRGAGRGYVVLTEDDYWATDGRVSSPFEQYASTGAKLTYSFSATDMPAEYTSEKLSAMNSFYNSGLMEVAVHTRGHVEISNLGALNISYTGTGTCLLYVEPDFEHQGGVFRTECSNTADNINLDLSIYRRLSRTFVGEGGTGGDNYDLGIVNYIQGKANYAVSFITTNNYKGKSFCLDTVVGLDITTQKSIYFDFLPFVEEEINGCKSDLQSKIPGANPIGIAYAGGFFNESVIDWLVDNGYKWGRTVLPNASLWMGNFDAFKIANDETVGKFYVPTIEEMRPRVWGALATAEAGGCVYTTLEHQRADMPYNLILQAASEYVGSAKLGTIGDAIRYLDSNAVKIDGRYYYLRRPDSADYRLRSDSKLVNAGDTSVLSGIPNLINLSGDTITDASGNLLVSSVNIGAYGTFNVDPQPPTITSISPSSPRLFKTFEATGTNLSNCKLYLNSVSLGTPASATSTTISDTALGTTRGFHWLIAEDTLSGVRCSTSSRIYIKNTVLDTVLLGRP